MASSRNSVWRVNRRFRSSRVMALLLDSGLAPNWARGPRMARGSGPACGAEQRFEAAAQHRIDLCQGNEHPQILETGDPLVGDAAGYDAGVMGKIGGDVERNAVEGDPFAHAHADGGDLVFAAGA